MSLQRRYSAHVVLSGQLFVMGGENDRGSRHKSVEYYDPAMDTWQMAAPMRHGRVFATASVSNGFIFVLGGLGKQGDLQSIEKYDPSDDSWIEVKINNIILILSNRTK